MLQTFPPIAFLDHSLAPLKALTRESTHSHEQTVYTLICDLEELAEHHIISNSELAVIAGKAVDILAFFRYDYTGLARENPWSRASIIHQIGCGMVQALRMLRPDLQHQGCVNASAYDLYRPATERRRPCAVNGKNWMQETRHQH